MPDQRLVQTDYEAAVEAALQATYGIGVDDCTDTETLFECWLDGWTVEETVEWIGQKYDLTPLSDMGW